MNQKEIDQWLALCKRANSEDVLEVLDGVYKIAEDPLLLNSVARILLQKGVGNFIEIPTESTEKNNTSTELTSQGETRVTWEVDEPWLRITVTDMKLPGYFTMENENTVKTRIGTTMHERIRKFFDKNNIQIPSARDIRHE